MSAGEGTWRAELHGDCAAVADRSVASLRRSFFALGLAVFLLVRRATGALDCAVAAAATRRDRRRHCFAWASSVRIACQWRTRSRSDRLSAARSTGRDVAAAGHAVVGRGCLLVSRALVSWTGWFGCRSIWRTAIGPRCCCDCGGLRKNPARRSAPAACRSMTDRARSMNPERFCSN